MNTTIKKRIEEINSGRVPEGYEKTSFGIFPCDWEKSKTLKDLGIFGKGRGIPGNKLISEGVPCVGYGDIYMKYNYHFEKAQSFVDESTAAESKKIRKGTLLFTATGETAEEIGKCVCYNGEEDIYAGGDIITFVPDRINSMFIAYQQYQNYALRQKASFGQGHSVVHIQKDRLEKLHIAYPQSSQEQSRIAEILMQCDKAIELQEKYIKQLELRKKALMQRLLTPKEGWTCKPLGYYFYKEKGKNVVISVEGKKPIIDMDYTINNRAINFSNDLSGVFALDNEIIILWDGASAGKVLYGIKGIVGSTFCVLRQVNKINSKYAYFYLDYAYEKNKKTREGSGIPHMPKDFLKKQAIWSPENILEQNKIANILTQADNEISLQTQKLDKLIKQRKALQQYLLTGIVRV